MASFRAQRFLPWMVTHMHILYVLADFTGSASVSPTCGPHVPGGLGDGRG